MKKKAKIIMALALFGAIAAAGYFIERFEKDAFVVETAAREEDMFFADAESGMISSGRININTADRETLTKLRGIGDALADRIIDYRTSHGAYGTVEEIMNVPGISESKFEDLQNDICAE